MANYAQNRLVKVYAGESLLCEVSVEDAREMKESGEYYFTNHGKDLKRVALLDSCKISAVRKLLGWMPHSKFWRITALNEGRSGQFTIGYPIPFAYEGHLREMRVSEVNG